MPMVVLMINVLCVLASAAAAADDGKTERLKPNNKTVRKKALRGRIILPIGIARSTPLTLTVPALGDNALCFQPILLIIAIEPAALVVEFISNA